MCRNRIDFLFLGVLLCFFLSGTVALLYQIVWMRHFSTIFGTSELAIVTVLVAYMGGLALGSWTASRLIDRVEHPVLTYAILEAGIAVSALLVPLFLSVIGRLHQYLYGGQPAPPGDGGVAEALGYVGLGCVVLMVPTGLMGATLPMLAKGVVGASEQIGRRVGLLYAMNTFGAVVGTVLAAFVLITWLGLWWTSFVGIALNLLVAVMGWQVAIRGGRAAAESSSDDATADAQTEPAVEQAGLGRYFVVLPVMLISGAIAFTYEVVWTRLLSHVLGGSLFAFATMLSAFLVGIAAGGLLGAAWAGDRSKSLLRLATIEVAAGTLSAIVYFGLGAILSITGLQTGSWESALYARASLVAMVLVPATVCLGATFPLAVRSLAEAPRQAGRMSARVYAWNTAGAIVGAVLAGFFLIPAIGFASTLKWAVIGNMLLAALVLLVVRPLPRVALAGAAAMILVFLFGFKPGPPMNLLVISPFESITREGHGGKLIHYAVGRSASVLVLSARGRYYLRTNGLPEAVISPPGFLPPIDASVAWMARLPKVLRPKTRNMLVVGFGGGTILEMIPSGIRNVDVIEIEPEVIRANRQLSNRRERDPLADSRINVIINDARGALALTNFKYDTIVSQPSHPWTPGASHLYTAEFMRLVRLRLSDDGIYVQWIGSEFIDEGLLRSLVAAVLEAFPHVQLYSVGGDFLVVGSPAPIDSKSGTYLAGADENGSLLHLSESPDMAYVEDVLAALLCDEAGCRKLAAGHPPITDDKNLMATHVFTEKAGVALDVPDNVRRVIGPIYYLRSESARPLTMLAHRFKATYLVRQVQIRQAALGVTSADLASIEPAARRTGAAIAALRAGDLHAAAQHAAKAIESDPNNLEAQFLAALTSYRRLKDAWTADNRRDIHADFDAFLRVAGTEFETTLGFLSADLRQIIEAAFYVESNQFARAGRLNPTLESFKDHRDFWVLIARLTRLELLIAQANQSTMKGRQSLRSARSLVEEMLIADAAAPSLLLNRANLAAIDKDSATLAASCWHMISLHENMADEQGDAAAAARRLLQSQLQRVLDENTYEKLDGSTVFRDPKLEEFFVEATHQGCFSAYPAGSNPR